MYHMAKRYFCNFRWKLGNFTNSLNTPTHTNTRCYVFITVACGWGILMHTNVLITHNSSMWLSVSRGFLSVVPTSEVTAVVHNHHAYQDISVSLAGSCKKMSLVSTLCGSGSLRSPIHHLIYWEELAQCLRCGFSTSCEYGFGWQSFKKLVRVSLQIARNLLNWRSMEYTHRMVSCTFHIPCGSSYTYVCRKIYMYMCTAAMWWSYWSCSHRGCISIILFF